MEEIAWLLGHTQIARAIKESLAEDNFTYAKTIFLRATAQGFDPIELAYLIGSECVFMEGTCTTSKGPFSGLPKMI
jgi:hypothetical protein